MKCVSSVPVISSLPVLSFLLLFPLMSGCYVDVPPATPEMVSARLNQLLADPDPEVRRTAAEALGKVGHQSAHTALLSALNDRDHRVRAAAALSLGSVSGSNHEAALIERLADSSESVRSASALALGETGGTVDREGLILKVLQHPESSARVAASRALLSLDSVSFSKDLVSALRDSNANVRQGVAAVLGETGDVRARSLLADLLKNDVDAGVRSEAAFRLGKVGDASVLEALSAVAGKDLDPIVREWARWAIRQLTLSRESGSENRRGQ